MPSKKNSGRDEAWSRRHGFKVMLRRIAESSPWELKPGESYFEILHSVGQLALGGGGIRFVSLDGHVVWLTPSGEVWKFDADRRLSDYGKFARWYSPQGHFTSSNLFSDSVTHRDCNGDHRVVIVRGQVHRSWFGMPACQQPEDAFQLIFRRGEAPTSGIDTAKKALFFAPYAQDSAWKNHPTANGLPAEFEIVVGSVQTEPHYEERSGAGITQ